MKTPIKSFEIIKEMYEHFVEKYRDLEPKLTICEKEDFDNVENTLKDYELMKQTEVVVADKKISDDDLEKLKDQRIFIGGIEPLFDEETQNKLKAFEIIKKLLKGKLNIDYDKKYDFYEICISTKYEDIVIACGQGKEEYEFLKEVLL